MRQVLDVNILNDAATQKLVGRLSIAPLVVAGFAAGWGLAQVQDVGAGPFSTWWTWVLALIAAYVVSLPVHELVHGLCFKLLGPAGTKVTFGYTSGMLYAGCPGTRYAAWKMVVVLLAPFVVLSLAYWALGQALGLGVMALCLFLLHGSGCMGDIYFTWLIAKHPEADYVEDTENGIALWSSKK